MTNPDISRVIADANEIMRPSAPDCISLTQLRTGIINEMIQHRQYYQPMPTHTELGYLVARDILEARGLALPEMDQ